MHSSTQHGMFLDISNYFCQYKRTFGGASLATVKSEKVKSDGTPKPQRWYWKGIRWANDSDQFRAGWSPPDSGDCKGRCPYFRFKKCSSLPRGDAQHAKHFYKWQQETSFARKLQNTLIGVYMTFFFSWCWMTKTGWWFQILFIFIPIWGRFPFWLIFFKGVETTN